MESLDELVVNQAIDKPELNCREPIELTIRLSPTSANSPPRNREKKLTLTSYPVTSRHLQLVIEDELQIPVCQQKLVFHSQLLLGNQCLLRALYLRDGDVVTVEYTTQADLKEVANVIQQMHNVIDFLKLYENWLEDLGPTLELALKHLIKPDLVESLVTNYFNLSDSDRSVSNRLYFVHNQGLDMTVELHGILSSITWNYMTLEMQYMEQAVLRVIWELSSTIGIRCLLLQKPDLIQQLCRSILREEIFPYQIVGTRAPNQRAITGNKAYVLAETMYKGIGVLANLAELPSYRLEIARRSKLIKQITAASLSPSYQIFCAQIVISTFLSLSYTPETHEYLVSPDLLYGILEVCRKFSSTQYGSPQSPLQQAYLAVNHHFATLFFSFISTGSFSYMKSKGFRRSSEDILSFMSKFLEDFTPEQVRQAEDRTTYFWSTIKPLVCLVYFSYQHYHKKYVDRVEKIILDLFLTSIRTGLFALKNLCLFEDCGDILEKEGLIDFLVCLPWYIAKELKDDANTVVQRMLRKVRFVPPSLVNIVKARIASWCVPLERVLSLEYVDEVRAGVYELYEEQPLQ